MSMYVTRMTLSQELNGGFPLKGTLTPEVLEKTLAFFWHLLPNEKVKIGSGRKSHFLVLPGQLAGSTLSRTEHKSLTLQEE